MGVFDNFPYTNIHDLNTDWLVKTVKKVYDKTEDVDQAVLDALNYAEETKKYYELITAENLFVNPDSFEGTDIQKLQSAVDYSLDNNLMPVIINRTYDITGGTVYISKTIHYPDNVSQYSRKKLNIFGVNHGKIIKSDVGFMFSASVQSGDITLQNIDFEGYCTDETDVTSCVDVRVFDCNKLIRLNIINCTFNWIGSVYYQIGPVSSGNMQSNLSIGNLYNKCKFVVTADEIYDIKFLGDLIEDGYTMFNVTRTASIRDCHIEFCCIEGMTSAPAINWHAIVSGSSIANNYFENNLSHIIIDHYFVGSITGNAFHGRGTIPASTHIDCVKLALAYDGYVIDGNICMEANANTTMFYFNTSSSYYTTYHKIVGNNYCVSPTVLTNVTDMVFNPLVIANNYPELSTYLNKQVVDLTSDFTSVYSRITGGTIKLVINHGIKTLIFNNVVVNAAISGGSVQNQTTLLAPKNNVDYQAIIGDNTSNYVAFIYVNANGVCGFRCSQAGTYKGLVTFV